MSNSKRTDVIEPDVSLTPRSEVGLSLNNNPCVRAPRQGGHLLITALISHLHSRTEALQR